MKKLVMISAKHLYLVFAVAALVFIIIGKIASNTVLVEVVAVVSAMYVVSALVHHHHDKTLTFEVFAEYILLAGLVLVILMSFLL